MTLRDAVKFYLPYLQATNRTCTGAQLAEEVVKIKKSDGASERYISDLRSRLKQFASSFDGKPVAEITSTDVDTWLRSLSDSETGKLLAATTRNNFRRVWMVAFNLASDRGYCVGNPVEKTAKAKAIETAPGILTVDETSRLIENAAEKLVPYIAIAAFAGLRVALCPRNLEYYGSMGDITGFEPFYQQQQQIVGRRFRFATPHPSRVLKAFFERRVKRL